MTKDKKSIAIIGGGAAGMMVAASILELTDTFNIHIFDKNSHLGAKVIISGGGRCNLTTGLDNKDLLLKKYTRGSEFLKFTLSKFSPKHTYEWFESNGVPLKTEEDLRVFPVSNDGHDVVQVFEKIFKDNNVQLHLNTNVTSIKKGNNKFIISCNKKLFEFDYAVITTGGNAYSKTGSSGDGYSFAKSLGHSITKLGPSLNSFITKESWVHELTGLSFPDAQLIDMSSNIKTTGPILFTHFGISGPATFALSSHLSFEEINETNPRIIKIIPEKDKDFQYWDNLLQKEIQENPKKLLKTILTKFFTQRFSQTIQQLTNIPENKYNSELNKKSRQAVSHLLSGGLIITLIKRRAGDEFVTAGGVNTDEINYKTMESLITPNLYFAGEVMNIDAITGGFNLQSSWATGRLAGKAIVAKK